MSNADEFDLLLDKLKSLGWMFDCEYPTPHVMTLWASLGRTTKPMSYYRVIKGVKRKRHVYLIRGKRAYAISKFTDTIATVGEWNAWYKDVGE